MDVEIQRFIRVWITAIISLCYCYYIAARVPRGFSRLLSLLPITFLFIMLPLHLSSFHLQAPTIFYLVWLGNFKLLLFSLDQGPLSSQPPLSLHHFISIALLPIKRKEDPSPQSPPSEKSTPKPPRESSENAKKKQSPEKAALTAAKVALLAAIVRAYNSRDFLHPITILLLYCCHVYLGVELVLAITAIPVKAILGLEIEPQFNEPYLATSLQDFWGQRWNLMVTSILRPTVYYPVRRVCSRILGRKWAAQPAILATFLVSGLIHEVIYYYLTLVKPTWEVTWFFVLHGICVGLEVAVKKAAGGKWRLHRAVSGLLTLGFVAVTGGWLFFPQIVRNGVDQRAISEYSILVRFLRERLCVLLDC